MSSTDSYDAAETVRPHVAYLFEVARRRAVLIGVCIVLFAGLAWAYSASQQREYSATATLLFRDPQFDQTLFGAQFFAPENDASREAATNRGLVALPVVKDLAAKRLGDGITGSHLSQAVTIETAGASDLVEVTATDPSPKRAVRMANAVAHAYIAYRRAADTSKILSTLNLVKRQFEGTDLQSGPAQALRRRAQDLQVLADAQTGNAEVAQAATLPTEPSRPRTRLNLTLGVLAGILVGFGSAVLRERLDRRLRDPAQLETAFAGPMLAVVPRDPALSGRLHSLREVPAPTAESFRYLRSNLRYFNAGEPLTMVVVVSPAVGDGKTTTAWYLGAAAADAGQRTLIVECDLRRPTLRARLCGSEDHMHDPHAAGLSMVLSGQAEVADIILRQEGEGPAVPDLLPAGAHPPNPTRLLESPRMEDVLNWATANYDFVVVDVPPPLVVADATPLLTRSGTGVLCVASLRNRTVDEVRELRTHLDHVNAFVTGVVANNARSRRATYYGGYNETPPSEHEFERAAATSVGATSKGD